MADWIPRTDAALNTFVANMTNVMSGTPANWGLTAGQVSDIEDDYNPWLSAVNTTNAAQAALHASVTNQATLRAALEATLRATNAIVQATPTVTDANKELAGFPVRDTTPTRAPVATTGVMIVSAVAMGALTQVVDFRDQSTPDTRAKPPGQKYAEIRAQVGGTVPLNGDTMETLGLDGRTPYTAVFEAGDENKVVYYCARWINTRGEPGPWGPVFMSTVPGQGGGS